MEELSQPTQGQGWRGMVTYGSTLTKFPALSFLIMLIIITKWYMTVPMTALLLFTNPASQMWGSSRKSAYTIITFPISNRWHLLRQLKPIVRDFSIVNWKLEDGATVLCQCWKPYIHDYKSISRSNLPMNIPIDIEDVYQTVEINGPIIVSLKVNKSI